MTSAADVRIREGSASDVDALERAWTDLYVHQHEHGMLLSVPPDGFAKWAAGLKPTLGRFGVLIIAERDGAIVGFIAGRVRTVPPYFGGMATGFISDVFVDEAARGAQIGRRMLDAAIAWYRTQRIARIELQVISGNTRGQKFYRELGWREELVQMVWMDDSPAATSR